LVARLDRSRRAAATWAADLSTFAFLGATYLVLTSTYAVRADREQHLLSALYATTYVTDRCPRGGI
jgi:hypothetical protein